MNWRLLLLPFSGIYWVITSIRNFLYDTGILKSTEFKNPVVICVGNLSVGGTGKSPHTMHLLNLLKDKFETAVLSRGYGRKTKGFKMANYSSRVYDIGDEPLQFFNRLKNSIVVSVCEDRVEGIKKLEKDYNPQLVILDDGFQHRSIKPSFSILLSDYSIPYFKDYLLPAGNLRESGVAKKKADIIIITKCPENFSARERDNYLERIKPSLNQKVFFSKIIYANEIIGSNYNLEEKDWHDYSVVLVTGIAKPSDLVKFAKTKFKEVKHMEYPDHYNFRMADIRQIEDEFKSFVGNKIILTTEKDYMRLKDEYALIEDLFYLPIEVEIDKNEEFNKIIIDYATKNATSS